MFASWFGLRLRPIDTIPFSLPPQLGMCAHKTNDVTVIYRCGLLLLPPNRFNFNPKDLQDLIDQLPSPFILMGDFNVHPTLWGCEKVNRLIEINN